MVRIVLYDMSNTIRYFFDYCIFFFNDTATTEIYTLSLHDALPISELIEAARMDGCNTARIYWNVVLPALRPAAAVLGLDRKSTRLNSSHMSISYAVFCLKKKK